MTWLKRKTLDVNRWKFSVGNSAFFRVADWLSERAVHTGWVRFFKFVQCIGNLPNEDSWTFNEVIFSHPGESKREQVERILIHLSYGVIIRDKLGNLGQFDDKTLVENESNLHTKLSFAHNISCWTHNVRPLVSLPAVQWSTHAFDFHLVNWEKVEIWRPNYVWRRQVDQFGVITARPRLETWSITTSRVGGKKFLILQTMP